MKPSGGLSLRDVRMNGWMDEDQEGERRTETWVVVVVVSIF